MPFCGWRIRLSSSTQSRPRTAEFIDAKQAKDWGIVSQVVAQDKLDATAAGFLDVLLSRPRPAILGLKEYLRVAPRMDEQAAIDYARALHSMVNTSAAMKKAH
jgi:enoyl-CoA hydratase